MSQRDKLFTPGRIFPRGSPELLIRVTFRVASIQIQFLCHVHTLSYQSLFRVSIQLFHRVPSQKFFSKDISQMFLAAPELLLRVASIPYFFAVNTVSYQSSVSESLSRVSILLFQRVLIKQYFPDFFFSQSLFSEQLLMMAAGSFI